MGKDMQYYCAGFKWGKNHNESQLSRFVEEGIWENGYDDKYLEIVKNIPIGSKIAAKTTYTRKENGETISMLGVYGIGTVIENPQNGKTLKVEWEKGFKQFNVDKGGAYQATIMKVVSEKNINAIFGTQTNSKLDSLGAKPDKVKKEFPLNQILYGPPGTGKTYNTIAKAVGIIDGLSEDEIERRSREDRNALKSRFEQLKNDGQIVFCTFHQSMSYEDFIEGIKPGVSESGQVVYDINAGVFKRIATVANDNLLYVNNTESVQLTFEEAFAKLQEDWEEDTELKFPLVTKDKDYTILGFTNSSIRFRKASGGEQHTLSIATLREQFYGKRIMKKNGVGIYYPSILNKLRSYRRLESSLKVEKKFVLIIDEINRGNVSHIFGELISLIEDDKRLGAAEGLEAILPYSKEKFGVPQNLYIIGTMNTADRSVEALDTALRRRFSFKEMSPDPRQLADYTVDDFQMADILTAINTRIEKLLDRDHQIGHSYLMVKDLISLKAVFRNKIIPLLQEYFFGDYGKIGLIMGKGFVEKIQSNSAFATFEYDESSRYDERSAYRMTDISIMNDHIFTQAIRLLLNK
jgi:5-methylcytosine-specific restriction protein B